MKLTIDTARDSPADIAKAIAFLRGFVGSASSSQEPAASAAEGMFGMFAEPERPTPQEAGKKPAAEDVRIIPY